MFKKIEKLVKEMFKLNFYMKTKENFLIFTKYNPKSFPDDNIYLFIDVKNKSIKYEEIDKWVSGKMIPIDFVIKLNNILNENKK